MVRPSGIALAFVALICGSARAGILYVANGPGADVVAVNTANGSQTVVSSGGYLSFTSGIAVEANGNLLVTDRGSRSLVQIDPNTGAQTLVASGGYFADPFNVAIASDGYVFVADAGPSGGPAGRIIGINPANGNQTLISTGQLFEGVRDVAVQQNGMLLVSDRGYQAGVQFADGSLIEVDPTTGAQTYLTSGDMLRNPDSIALTSGGGIYAADHDANGGRGSVFSVDPTTGAQSLVSDYGYFMGGPSGIALDGAGNIFVDDNDANVIVMVDPNTGAQTLVSSGGLLTSPYAMAFATPAPEPSTLALAVTGALVLVGRKWKVRRGTVG